MDNKKRRLTKTILSTHPKAESFALSLLLIGVIAIVSELVWMNWRGFESLLFCSGAKVLEAHQYYRLWTALLVHSDFKHLLSNAYMLFILGYFVYGYFGLMIYPILTFFMAGIVNFFAILTYNAEIQIVGASGLVYLLAGFWLVLYLLIERGKTWWARILRVVGVGLLILFPTSFEPQVSYRTHLIGCVVGILLALIYFFLNKTKLHLHEEWIDILEDEEPQ